MKVLVTGGKRAPVKAYDVAAGASWSLNELSPSSADSSACT
jgi:hypothetical protein